MAFDKFFSTSDVYLWGPALSLAGVFVVAAVLVVDDFLPGSGAAARVVAVTIGFVCFAASNKTKN